MMQAQFLGDAVHHGEHKHAETGEQNGTGGEIVAERCFHRYAFASGKR